MNVSQTGTPQWHSVRHLKGQPVTPLHIVYRSAAALPRRPTSQHMVLIGARLSSSEHAEHSIWAGDAEGSALRHCLGAPATCLVGFTASPRVHPLFLLRQTPQIVAHHDKSTVDHSAAERQTAQVAQAPRVLMSSIQARGVRCCLAQAKQLQAMATHMYVHSAVHNVRIRYPSTTQPRGAYRTPVTSS